MGGGVGGWVGGGVGGWGKTLPRSMSLLYMKTKAVTTRRETIWVGGWVGG